MEQWERELRESCPYQTERFYALRHSRVVRLADRLNDVAWFSKLPKWMKHLALRFSYFVYVEVTKPPRGHVPLYHGRTGVVD